MEMLELISTWIIGCAVGFSIASLIDIAGIRRHQKFLTDAIQRIERETICRR